MLLLLRYKNSLVAVLIFLVTSVNAIAFNMPILWVIPFLWLLLPRVVDFCVTRTEQLFWLLIFSLPFSTELQISQSLGLDFPDEPFMILLTAIAILKFLHQPKYFPNYLSKQPLFFLLLLIMGWTLLSAAFAENQLLGFKFFLARIWYIVPFVLLPQILLQTQTSITKMAQLFLIAMTIIVVQTLVRHSSYGFSFVLIKKAIDPFFRNHVNYSAMLVCLLPLAWAMFTLTPISNTRRKWILWGLGLGIIALFFAYSRGAWLALLVGLLVAWSIRKKWFKQLVVITIIIMLGMTSWLVKDYHYMQFAPDHDRTIFHTDFKEHMAATVALKDVSNAERFYRWVAGFKMFVEKPITGFGPNSFYSQYKNYTVSSFETWVSDNPEHSTVHNYFLLTLLEQGLPGLLLFCCLYIGMLFKAQQLFYQLQNNFYSTIALTIAIILGMLGVINFMSDMVETDKLGSLFWLCLGLILVLDKKLAEEQNNLA